MPGHVTVVDRRAQRSLFDRIPFVTLLRSFGVTAKHGLRNLRRGKSGGGPGAVTVQVPEEGLELPDAFRGMPVLVASSEGEPRCVACGLCQRACPSHCIEVVPESAPAEGRSLRPQVFDLDMGRCLFCGLCEEACPEQAIVMSRVITIAGYDRASLRFDLERLLVPEELLAPRLALLRREDEERAGVGGIVGLVMDDCGSPALATLLERLPEAVVETHAQHGDVTACVDPDRLLAVLETLRDDVACAFEMLADVTAVDHHGETPRYEVVYHLVSIAHGQRVRIKTRVDAEKPRVASACALYASANWMEREVFDLYGIRFEGHPDLRRILLPQVFEGHPLRKDYPKARRQPLPPRER